MPLVDSRLNQRSSTPGDIPGVECGGCGAKLYGALCGDCLARMTTLCDPAPLLPDRRSFWIGVGAGAVVGSIAALALVAGLIESLG